MAWKCISVILIATTLAISPLASSAYGALPPHATATAVPLAANQTVVNPAPVAPLGVKTTKVSPQKSSNEIPTVPLQTLIALCSALFVLSSAIAAFTTLLVNRHIQQWVVNYNLLTHTHDMLNSKPELLSLYDIDIKLLTSDGVTSSELIFVYGHMDAAGAFYRIKGDKKVCLTEFRKNFIKNARVRLIWKKYLREKMFSPSPFRTAVDQYIAEYEQTLEEKTQLQ